MKEWRLYFSLFIGVSIAIKVTISGHDEVLWSDPKLNLFHLAKYEHAPTVKNLASLLYSETKSNSVLINKNYITHYCGKVPKKTMAYMIYQLGRLHHAGEITLEIVRRFLPVDCLVEGVQFHSIVEGSLLSYLILTTPLIGSVEKLTRLPKLFLTMAFAKAHNNAHTLVELRRDSSSFVLWRADTLLQEVKDVIFLLDGASVKKVTDIYEQSILPEILRPPRDLASFIISQIYMIHFAFVMAAHNIETMEPVPIKVRSNFLREEAIMKILSLDVCVCSRHDGDDSDIKCHNRMAMFVKAAADLEGLVRNYCGRTPQSFPSLNLNQSFKSMSAVLTAVMNNSGLMLSPVMMVRLKFGLVALALTEMENYGVSRKVDLNRVFKLMREAFAVPDDVPLADLKLLSSIIWDHVKHHPENDILLDLFIDYLEMTPRFCYFLLDCRSLDSEFKKNLYHTFKVNHFKKQIEYLPKLYMKAPLMSVFNMDQQNVFSNFLTLLQQNTDKNLAEYAYNLEDIKQSKIFFKQFVPWFLNRYFIKMDSESSETTMYSRPILSCNGFSILTALRLTLQASFTLGVSFPKISFHHFLNRRLQKLWALSDAKIFDESIFDSVILHKTISRERI